VDYEKFGSCNDSTPLNGSAYTPFNPLPSLEVYGWGMAVIGLAIWLDAYVFVTCFNMAATRQILNIRTEFIKVSIKINYVRHSSTLY
jgi:hypothetical protein